MLSQKHNFALYDCGWIQTNDDLATISNIQIDTK